MPPNPTWIRGRAAVARFFVNRVRRAVADRLFRVVALQANGRPAAGFYRKEDDGTAPFFALHVLEFDGGAIRTIDHFAAASSHRAFFAAGLPRAFT